MMLVDTEHRPQHAARCTLAGELPYLSDLLICQFRVRMVLSTPDKLRVSAHPILITGSEPMTLHGITRVIAVRPGIEMGWADAQWLIAVMEYPRALGKITVLDQIGESMSLVSRVVDR